MRSNSSTPRVRFLPHRLRSTASRVRATLDRVDDCDAIRRPTRLPLSLRFDVAQAVPKGAKMDFIVEKATELGAGAMLPFRSERTVARDGRRRESGTLAALGKVRRAAMRAADAYARRPGAPVVTPPFSNASATTMRCCSRGSWRLACCCARRCRICCGKAARALIVIGPGGWIYARRGRSGARARSRTAVDRPTNSPYGNGGARAAGGRGRADAGPELMPGASYLLDS